MNISLLSAVCLLILLLPTLPTTARFSVKHFLRVVRIMTVDKASELYEKQFSRESMPVVYHLRRFFRREPSIFHNNKVDDEFFMLDPSETSLDSTAIPLSVNADESRRERPAVFEFFPPRTPDEVTAEYKTAGIERWSPPLRKRPDQKPESELYNAFFESHKVCVKYRSKAPVIPGRWNPSVGLEHPPYPTTGGEYLNLHLESPAHATGSDLSAAAQETRPGSMESLLIGDAPVPRQSSRKNNN